MQTESLVEVERLSKVYARSPAAARRRAASVFSGVLFARSALNFDELRPSEFWALGDVSFQVKRGEALGIIGLNGSGKTTLLRILAGQLLPDQGEVRLTGSTAALIDASAGFRMNATGRENIFLKGASLGRSHSEMEAAFDGIVEFAELDDAIDAPLASYSSGMLMRLAFSINTASVPDILLIDETLSVGDFRFRQRCLSRLRDLRERSCFILVSHSMNDIKRFCSRVLVLSRGRVVFEGQPEAAVQFYENSGTDSLTPEKLREAVLEPWYNNSEAVRDLEIYWCNAQGERIDSVDYGMPLYFDAAFTLNHKPRHLVMGVPLWAENGQYVTGFSTEVSNARFDVVEGVRVRFRLEIPNLLLNPGTYLSNFAMLDGPEYLVRTENPPLTVRPLARPHWGVVSLPHEWHKVTSEEEPGRTEFST